MFPYRFSIEMTNSSRFYGPAPLHHTLLSGRKHTGITLQTLDPIEFDNGTVVAQTPYPGFEHSAKTIEELRTLMAQKGSEMLVESIKHCLHVPPIEDVGWYQADKSQMDFPYAPKISTKDRHIDWGEWSAAEILRRQQIIGPLWNFAEANINGRKEDKRIIWERELRKTDVVDEANCFSSLPGHPVLIDTGGASWKLQIRTVDGQILIANEMKIEGGPVCDAFTAVRRAGMLTPSNSRDERSCDLFSFVSRLR